MTTLTMSPQLKKSIIIAVAAIAVTLYYGTLLIISIYTDIDRGLLILGDGAVTVGALMILTVLSLVFSLRIIYHRDKKWYMALGLFLMITSIGFILLFSLWLFGLVVNPG